MQDSIYNCKFCHGKNHFAKDFMLRKLSEKKEGEDDEEYHMCKVEEMMKKKTSNIVMNVLVVQENVLDDEFGGVEVWSTYSEDEELCKATHGKALVVKESNAEIAGK